MGCVTGFVPKLVAQIGGGVAIGLDAAAAAGWLARKAF
jgi:hypothetical protein